MKGKNKLVPRLLGVTKESILRVDEKTKEVRVVSMFSSLMGENFTVSLFSDESMLVCIHRCVS